MENSLGCVWVPKLAFLLLGFTLANLHPPVSGKSARFSFPSPSGRRLSPPHPGATRPLLLCEGTFRPFCQRGLGFVWFFFFGRGVSLWSLAAVSFCITSPRWGGREKRGEPGFGAACAALERKGSAAKKEIRGEAGSDDGIGV